MGAINHQPCGKYVAISIALSRSLTLGRSELDLSNVALEDILLAEQDEKVGSISPMLEHLHQSRAALRAMMETTMQLRDKMDEESYQDLPSLATMNLDVFGEQCRRADLHRDSFSWNVVADTMRQDGFYAVLDIFDEMIQKMMTDTNDLVMSISACRSIIEAGELTQVLEYNGAGNFKAEFIKLYASWETFYQTFQASSIISTELWYRFNNKPSLLGAGTLTQAVA